MSTEPSQDIDRRLDGALHHHLDGVMATTDLTDGALARARRMRRTRRLGVTSASVVAALAVVSPLVWSQLQGPNHAPAPGTTSSAATGGSPTPPSTRTGAGPSAPSGSASPEPTDLPSSPVGPPPTHTVSPPLHRVTLGLGAAPGIPDVVYLHGTTVHVGDHSTRLVLPERTPLVFNGVFADGTILASVLNDGGSWDLVWFGRDGRELDRQRDAMMPVLDSNLTRVAWLDANERVHLSDSRGSQIRMWRETGLFPTGVAGDRVYANNTSRRGFVLDAADGSVTAHHEGEFGPVHAGLGLGIVRLVSETGPSCFRLVELTTDTVRWTACGDVFPTGGFSPDGRFLIAGFQGDGGSSHEVSVLRVADAHLVLRVDSSASGLTLEDYSINDDGTAISLVATTLGETPESTRQSLARCPLDGSACAIVGPDEPASLDSAGNPAPVWAVMQLGF